MKNMLDGITESNRLHLQTESEAMPNLLQRLNVLIRRFCFQQITNIKQTKQPESRSRYTFKYLLKIHEIHRYEVRVKGVMSTDI